jgi:hypothetical protein
MSDQQFFYKTRKQALGPFKRRLWDLPADLRGAIGADLERMFGDMFERLRVKGTRAVVERFVKPAATTPPLPEKLAATLA